MWFNWPSCSGEDAKNVEKKNIKKNVHTNGHTDEQKDDRRNVISSFELLVQVS